MDGEDPVSAFIEAASVPLGGVSHASGNLERAEALRAAHPDLLGRDVFGAALLGDHERLRAIIDAEPARAWAKGGTRGWDPLTYLCFSRYLRLERESSARFVECARLLLDHGASASTGFVSTDHEPEDAFESVIYAASGIARDAELTRLLLERGADPNDGETPYHVGETYDNACVEALVESGKLDADGLATILLRKHDWHDLEGIRWLLDRGADPNRMTRWGHRGLHKALLRDNSLAIVEVLLDHGADPALDSKNGNGFEIAARQGRGDVLELFASRGEPFTLEGLDALLAACARGGRREVERIARDEPQIVVDLMGRAGPASAEFAGIGNVEGLGLLLDLGAPMDARWTEPDGYLGQGAESTPLHVAAWCARHRAVELLVLRGAPVDATNRRGETPLALAVRAAVDSHWTQRRSTDSVRALLAAGADPRLVDRFPSGDSEIDDLVSAARRRR